MSTSWLKTIGHGDKPPVPDWRHPWVHFKRMPKRVRVGDELVLYSAGRRKRGDARPVFALATIESPVRENERRATHPHEDRYLCDVSYTVNLAPAQGIPLESLNGERRDLRRSIGRRSYIELREDEARRAREMLRGAGA